jgi:hypothetical protein
MVIALGSIGLDLYSLIFEHYSFNCF